MPHGSVGVRLGLLRPERLPIYARFLRVYIIDPQLAACVGIVAALAAVPPNTMTWVMGAIGTIWSLAVLYLVHALDDITGVKTGTDVKTSSRKAAIGEPKLLASGILTMDEANAIVLWLGAVVVTLGIPLLLMAPPVLAAGMVVGALLACQYSYGARWSYRGFGELAVVVMFGACAFVPYVYHTRRVTVGILGLALLVGLSIVLVTFCSNRLDLAEDSSTDRKSLVVILGVQRTKAVFLAVMAAFWSLYAVFWWRGVLPPGTAVIVVLMPLHVLAAYRYCLDDAVAARKVCFWSNRVHAVLLMAVLASSGSAV